MATEGQVTCIREGKVRFFKRQIKNKISFLAGGEWMLNIGYVHVDWSTYREISTADAIVSFNKYYCYKVVVMGRNILWRRKDGVEFGELKFGKGIKKIAFIGRIK